MTEQGYIQTPPVGTKRQSNPLWFRENSSNTFGCTAQPSNVNPQLGIEDINLKPGSQAQLQNGILMSGLLKSVIGSISFQIKLSHAGYPFVQTISTELPNADDHGNKTYWEHILFKPAVKAQIMRFFEALQTGSAVQQAPAPAYNQAPPMGYGQPQYGQPQYGQPQYAPQPPAYNPVNYGQPQGYNQVPVNPAVPDYSMYQQQMAQNNVNVEASGAPGGNPPLQEDDLPV